MKRTAVFVLLALLTTACSASGKPIFALNDGGSDAGPAGEQRQQTDPTPTGGTKTSSDTGMVIKNLSFSGALEQGGKFTFVLGNEGTKSVQTVTEIRITVAAGEFVIPTKCDKLASHDEFSVEPHTTSQVITMPVEVRSSGGESVASTVMICQSIKDTVGSGVASFAASTTDAPSMLTLKGIYTDASKWTAKAAVE